MRTTIFAVLFSLISLFASAQTDYENQYYVDSLCSILPDLPLDIEKLKVEREIIDSCNVLETYTKYASVFFDDAQKLGNKEYEMYARSALTRVAYYNGEFEKAMQSAFRTLAMADSLDDKRYQMGTYSHLFAIYSAQNDIENSIKYIRKSISLAYFFLLL